MIILKALETFAVNFIKVGFPVTLTVIGIFIVIIFMTMFFFITEQVRKPFGKFIQAWTTHYFNTDRYDK